MTSRARSLTTNLLSRLSRRKVGIAIAADSIYVVPIAEAGRAGQSAPPWMARLQTNLLDAPEQAAETIHTALAACPHLEPRSGDRLHIVVMPPLALARRVAMPRLTAAEYRRVIARDTARYFAVDRTPRVVGVLPFTKRSTVAGVFAASTSAQLVDGIVTAVTEFGGDLASLDCAYASWTGAAKDLWPSFGRSESAVIVCQPDVTEIVYSTGARPELVRRLSGRASSAQLMDAIGVNSPGGPVRSVAIIGSADRYDEIARALSAAGIAVMPELAERSLDAGTLAATFAAVGTGPGLYPERMYAESRQASVRLARSLGSIAVAMLLLAAIVLYVGTRAQLRKVVAERTALRSNVAKALSAQSDIGSLRAQSAAISSLAATAPRWSAILATLTEALPADAYLTSLQIHSDSVVMEGVASRAAGVFEALQRDRAVTAVHANAPVRQQLQDGTPVEHFAVAARLSSPTGSR